MVVTPKKIRYNVVPYFTNQYLISLYFDLCETTLVDIDKFKHILYKLEVDLGNDGSYNQRMLVSAKSYSLKIRSDMLPKTIKELLVDIFSNNTLCLLYNEYEPGIKFLTTTLIQHINTEKSRLEEF